MGLYQGSFRELADATAADVSLVDGNGDQLTGFDSSRPATATLSALPFSATSQVLLVSNPARREFLVYNATNKPVNIAYAATSSATAFSFILAAGASFESVLNSYTGVISAFWPAAATGSLHTTEITT